MLLALLLSLAHADSADDCLIAGRAALMAHKFVPAVVETDALVQGHRESYWVQLFAGHEYVVFACGDDRIKDLDLIAYDTKHEVVAHDSDRDSTPFIAIATPETGVYQLDVLMIDSAMRRANFHFVVMER